MAREAQTGTQAIERAADLLARVVRAEEPVTFTELCSDTGYARSTTSRILTALQRAELVGRTDGGALVPGALFDVYAGRLDADARLAEIADPHLEALGRETGETINLAVPRHDGVVQIAQVDATFYLGSRNWVGVDVPAHASALGKVLYAHGALLIPSGRLDALTEHTLASSEAMERQVSGIRRRGFAVTVDELEIGLSGVAAAVERDGHVVASLGLSGPTSRVEPHLDELGELVLTHARALTSRLTRTRKEGAA